MERRRVPIETAATVGGLRRLIEDLPADTELRGSVVAWRDDEPVLIVGLAPEYADEEGSHQ